MYSAPVSTTSSVEVGLSCPLKSAWLEAGMSESDVALFCEIAAEADYGTLEAAGLTVDIETWQPGGDGCCLLKIRAG